MSLLQETLSITGLLQCRRFGDVSGGDRRRQNPANTYPCAHEVKNTVPRLWTQGAKKEITESFELLVSGAFVPSELGF